MERVHVHLFVNGFSPMERVNETEEAPVHFWVINWGQDDVVVEKRDAEVPGPPPDMFVREREVTDVFLSLRYLLRFLGGVTVSIFVILHLFGGLDLGFGGEGVSDLRHLRRGDHEEPLDVQIQLVQVGPGFFQGNEVVFHRDGRGTPRQRGDLFQVILRRQELSPRLCCLAVERGRVLATLRVLLLERYRKDSVSLERGQ